MIKKRVLALGLLLFADSCAVSQKLIKTMLGLTYGVQFANGYSNNCKKDKATIFGVGVVGVVGSEALLRAFFPISAWAGVIGAGVFTFSGSMARQAFLEKSPKVSDIIEKLLDIAILSTCWPK